MSLSSAVPNPYLQAFIFGVLYGSVVCVSSCLPYVASYIAGVGACFRQGALVTLTFSSGRLAAYALISGAVGLLSGALRLIVSAETFLPFQAYSSVAFGVVTIIIGLTLLLKIRASSCNCNTDGVVAVKPQRLSRKMDFRAFSLGLTRGLVICPPLLALLLYALPFTAPLNVLVLAVPLGLGTVLSPLLLLGGVTGWLLNKAPLFRRWIALFGVVVLILLGLVTLITSIMAI
jgi:sulfite exporter TauE/SafE